MPFYKSLSENMHGSDQVTVAEYLQKKIANDDGETKWPHGYDPDSQSPGPPPDGYNWKLGVSGYWTLGSDKLEVK